MADTCRFFFPSFFCWLTFTVSQKRPEKVLHIKSNVAVQFRGSDFGSMLPTVAPKNWSLFQSQFKSTPDFLFISFIFSAAGWLKIYDSQTLVSRSFLILTMAHPFIFRGWNPFSPASFTLEKKRGHGKAKAIFAHILCILVATCFFL